MSSVAKRKVCVVTGSRADYGLLRWVMDGVRRSTQLALQVLVTGMHLSPEFGHTFREIEADGFSIDQRVDSLLSADTPAAVAAAMGLGLIGGGRALEQLRPDVLVALGDRFEVFAIAAAALVARIPVAHLHGGERSEGAFDESMRHAITKMSQLHFVAAEEYRRRVIQLGEDPARVFMVGGLGVDSILKTRLLDRSALEAELGFEFGPRTLMVTFHPTTLEDNTAPRQMQELFAALDTLTDARLIFTMPNADTEGRALLGMVDRYVAGRPHARAYLSLGQARYLSCLQFVDGVVGNSSSGLTEVPSFHKGTINIGDRQRGRLRADSVIDCAADRGSIVNALQRLFSPAFQAQLPGVRNPYGNGGASERIVDILSQYRFDASAKKTFHDIDWTGATQDAALKDTIG